MRRSRKQVTRPSPIADDVSTLAFQIARRCLPALAVFGSLAAPAVQAATIEVTAGAVDSTDNDTCSLVEAVIAANDNTNAHEDACTAGGVGADTLVLPSLSRFSFSQANDSADGGSALPTIDTAIIIQGNGATIERAADAGSSFRIIRNVGSGELNLENLILRGGLAEGSGDSGAGGAIRSRAPLSITDCTLSGNSAGAFGGAIDHRNAILTLQSSTISGNSAVAGGGVFIDTDLYGISAQITNSTISGNSAGQHGGGIFNGDGHTRIVHSTIVGNTAAASSGSGVSSYGDVFTETIVEASIISGNANSHDVSLYQGSENSFTSNGDNLIGLGDAGTDFNAGSDQTGVTDPKLGLLADNGGPNLTHLPAVDSPAVDAASNSTSTLDQRGVNRPIDGDQNGSANRDIGAVEFVPPIVVDGSCSLIQAIENANTTGTHAGCEPGSASGPDFVQLPADTLFNHSTAHNATFGANALPVIYSEIIIQGNGSTLQRDAGAANDFRMLLVGASGDLELRNATVSGGRASGGGFDRIGGGVLALGRLTVTRGSISGNSAYRGGGLYMLDPSALNATTVSGNYASGYAGGVATNDALSIIDSTISSNTAASTAGGLLTFDWLSINDSTISGNTANRAAGLQLQGESNLRNVTVSGNTALGGGYGGFNNGGLLSMTQVTIADNTGYALQNSVSGVSTISNSLILDGACNGAATNALLGTNFASDASCTGFTIDANASVLLDPLADNGGRTQTHMLQAGHPGLDAASGSCLATDQRGVPRPQNGGAGLACDVGAFEVFNAAPIVVDDGAVDPTDGDGLCSLVEAVGNANDTLNGGQPHVDCGLGDITGRDTLMLPADGGFTFTQASDSTDGSNALPSITSTVVIEGNGSTVQRDGAADPFRLLHVAASGDLMVNNLTLSGGLASGYGIANRGGAFRVNGGTLRLYDSTVSLNSASTGGGIDQDYGFVKISGSTFGNNSAVEYGGAIDNFYGDLNVVGSTLNDNSAARGGAVRSYTPSDASTTTRIVSSTLSGNSASSRGGGIDNGNGTTEILHSTITDNSSPDGSGVRSFPDSYTETPVQTSIIAGNTGSGDVSSSGPNNSFTSLGDNLIGSGDTGDFGSAGDVVNVADPMLGVLADNGGPTFTNLPQPGSPAIDTAQGGCPVADQRLVTRPVDADNDGNAVCDKGAVEAPADMLGDRDMDDMSDFYEINNGLNPDDPADRNLDPDGDGLTNFQESQAGTAANDVDSDDDGLHDGIDNDPTDQDSNLCSGPDAVFENTMVQAGNTVQCGASNSVSVQSSVMVNAPGGGIEIYSPRVSFGVGFALPLGATAAVTPIDPSQP